MAAPPNVELEAAKFLEKLINDSKDEPARLATKLYVILQHMKASGKENSLPYQVISRAMETVINQHGLDIEALTSSRLPSSSGPQGESATIHAAGSSQTLPVAESKSGMPGNDPTRTDGFGSYHPSAASNSLGHDLFQGSVSQRSGRSFDHESPSSIDTKSATSHSQDRRETASLEQQGALKNPNRGSVKRKKSDTSAIEPPDSSIQQPDSYNTVPDLKKERVTSKVEMPDKFPVAESWKQGFKSATNFPETSAPGHLPSNHANFSMANFNSASCSSAAGIQMGAERLLQAANPSSVGELGVLRSPANRDTGRASSITNMPFKEHHLKQLRAQCLVFLAFRNGLAPKRLHLEIALGNILLQEGTSGSVDGAQNELMLDKGKRPSTLESSCTAEGSLPQINPSHVKIERATIGSAASGCVPEVDGILNETKSLKMAGTESSHIDSEKHVPPGRGAFEAESQTGLQVDRSNMMKSTVHSNDGSLQPGGANQGDFVVGTNKLLNSERWTGVPQNDFSRSALPAPIPHDLGIRKDGSSYVSQHEGDIQNLQHADSHLSGSWKAIQGNSSAVDKTMSITDGSKIVPVFDSGYTHRSPSPLGSELEEEEKSVSADLAPSSKQTLSEKWIIAHQKRKVVNEQKWVRKLQKTDQRIECRFNELKETVTSAEDISAKTRSIIELKKLQLLELQRRLRRNIMNDFFKPVQSEMDQLKSIKKHRIGRRMKHVEKYEQKMKEERQKRIRERQKEFFSEIEFHKERLEDVFKFKRERCKGFVRFVKEFHKRKERIHREKVDRIQREKINLLKINDVEGYLRMVQDAKSDRVKQLLKETEKYLQKLGSKLQEAKTSAREVDIDENLIATFDESRENAAETEDGNDQAKHYKESNEKYYLIAHSIKESITEQPTGIQGGKLREYQMNGLRWLVSLYNNHLNGILADEMGLGKTVQVISLLCYLMEAKNDRGPFLVVVPSSVLPGWERELSFWAPGINKIVYAGPPEERRRLFKDCIVHQKFNVLLTTYEYLMNKHDRPKLSKIHWHYVIIDEGHRIKNASCKLNADLKHYQSSHRLLLTGTPLQNSLEELWALLNFLLPNIFNSSDDFSQWFNKPFEGSGDTSPDEALLSEEENLLIINRLHQVLRPFVLRRLKHKVENQLPEKIERLVRCEASAYQKLLMMRVEENLGSLGIQKGRAIHNTVMELRNICNHPYLSQLHVEEVDSLIPKHFLPPIIRLCGKLEMLDRLLPKLKETNHRVLFFSTMTRLLDIMEDYLVWKQYRYLRLDGHTSGQDRGALIEKFNQPDSPFFIFLLSIRAGGVGVNLQAADTVIIFDTDWNPQVDLQAQARAHRIGQKKDVLVLRLETVKSVEEQVRAAAEHKLGVANQSITAGFFDNNTSAEDRREYLESLLRESKKEEAAPVLDDDSLNDILARSEPEIAVFEAIDKRRREEEMATWKTLIMEHGGNVAEALPPLPSRLVTEDDLKAFYEAMKKHEAARDGATSSSGVKRKGGYIGGFDSQQYGRGKRAREVRSYEEQWSEEEFEKMCQSEYPDSIMFKDEKVNVPQLSESVQITAKVGMPLQSSQPPPPSLDSTSLVKEVTPPVKRGRGRPRRIPTGAPPPAKSKSFDVSLKSTASPTHEKTELTGGLSQSQHAPVQIHTATLPGKVVENPKHSEQSVKSSVLDSSAVKPSPRELLDVNKVDLVPQGQALSTAKFTAGSTPLSVDGSTPVCIPELHIDNPQSTISSSEAQPTTPRTGRRQSQKPQNAVEPIRRRGRKRGLSASADSISPAAQDQNSQEPLKTAGSAVVTGPSGMRPSPVLSGAAAIASSTGKTPADCQNQSLARLDTCTETTPRRRGRKKSTVSAASVGDSVGQYSFARQPDGKDAEIADSKIIATRSRQVNISQPQSIQEKPHSADGIGKPPETTHTSTVEDIKQVVRPANFPPISSKGKTNVIVLALDATSVDLDPIGTDDKKMQEKQTFSKLQIESTPSASTSKPEHPRLNLSHATNIEVAKLDEELSAPPGFETSRPCLFNATVTKSGEHNDPGISSSPNAKLGSLVLALKSASQTIVPTFGCPTVCEKDDTSEVHSFKESGQRTAVPSSPAEGCSAILKVATDKVVSCHPEEDMLAPPGFDVPQKCLLESVALSASTLACDDDQISDKLAISAVNKDCQGPVGGDIGHDTSDAPLSVLDSNKAAAEIVKEKGPSNTEQHLVNASTTSMTDPCTAAATTLEFKEQDSHEIERGYIGCVTSDPSAVCVVESDTAAALTSKHGLDGGDDGLVNNDAVAVVDSDTAATLSLQSRKVDNSAPCNEGTSALESKEHVDPQCTDLGNFANGTSDAPLAVCSTDPVITAALPSELNENFQLGLGKTKENLVGASSASDTSLDNAATAAIELEVHGEAHCPSNPERYALDSSTVSVAGPCIASVAELEMKGQEELLGPGNSDLRHDTSDGPLATDVVDSDIAVAVTLKLEEKGPIDNEQNMQDALTTVFVPGTHSIPTSALELKEPEESQGLNSCDIEQHISDVPLTVCVGDSSTTVAHPMELKEKRDHGSDSGDIGHDAIDASLAVCVGDADTSVALTLELEEKKDHHGPDTSDQNAFDASTSSVADCNNAAASTLESKEQASIHGLACGDIVHDAIYGPVPVSVVDPDVAATVTLELKGEDLGPGYTEQTVVDTSTAPVDVSAVSIAAPCNSTSSSLKSEQQEDSPGFKREHLGPGYTEENVGDTSAVPVGVSPSPADDPCNATTSLKLKEHKTSPGLGYTEQYVDDTSAVPVDVSTVSVGDPSNTTASSLKSKEQEESPGPGYTERNVVDTFTASADEPCIATPSSLKSKEQEESPGPGYTEQNVVVTTVPGDVSTASGDDPRSPTPSSLKSKEQEESHGPGYTEQNVVDTSYAPVDVSTAFVDDSCNAIPSSLKSKELEESPGPDTFVPDGVNSSTVSYSSPSDAAASVLKPKEQEESHASVALMGEGSALVSMENQETCGGPGNTECASVAGHQNAEDSALESKQQEKLHSACDLPTTSMAIDSDSAKESALALKVEEGLHDAAGSRSPVMAGNNTSSVLNPEPQEEGLISGAGSNPTSNVAVSAMELKKEEKSDLTEKGAVSAMELKEERKVDLTEVVAVSAVEAKEELKIDLTKKDAVSATELKEAEKVDGPNDDKTEDEGGDNHTSSHVVDTMVEPTSESQGKTEDEVGDDHTASHVSSDGKTEDAVGGNHISQVVDSDTVVDISESKGKAEDEIGVNHRTSHLDSDGKTENAVGDNPTSHVSDTVVETTVVSKEKTEDKVGDNHTISHVSSDGKTEDVVGGNHTTQVVDSDTVVEATLESEGKSTVGNLETE